MTNRSEEVYVERKRPIETVGSAGTEAVAWTRRRDGLLGRSDSLLSALPSRNNIESE